MVVSPFSVAGRKGFAYNVGMIQEAKGLRQTLERAFEPHQHYFIPIIVIPTPKNYM